jgi:hypothetical protein
MKALSLAAELDALIATAVPPDLADDLAAAV